MRWQRIVIVLLLLGPVVLFLLHKSIFDYVLFQLPKQYEQHETKESNVSEPETEPGEQLPGPNPTEQRIATWLPEPLARLWAWLFGVEVAAAPIDDFQIRARVLGQYVVSILLLWASIRTLRSEKYTPTEKQ